MKRSVLPFLSESITSPWSRSNQYETRVGMCSANASENALPLSAPCIWDRSNSLATSAVKQVETETVPGIRAQKVAWERLLDKEEPASSVSELLPAAGRFAPKASVRERRLGNHCPLPLVVLDLAICAPSLPFRVVHSCPCQHM